MGFPHMCSGLAAAILIKTVIMKMQIKSFVDCRSQTLLNQTENWFSATEDDGPRSKGQGSTPRREQGSQ